MRTNVYLLIFVLCFTHLRCSRYATIERQKVAQRTLQNGNVLATYYPVTHQNAHTRDAVVLTDPVLLDQSVLHRGHDGGIIPTLNYHGYPVWLIRYSTYESVDLVRFGQHDIPRALKEITKLSGARRYILGGLSLGGQAVLHFLNGHLAKKERPYEITKIFFMGCAFDYNYPNSFARVAIAAKYQKRSIQKLCTSNTEKICNYLRSAYAKVPVRRFLNYLPETSPTPKQSFGFVSDLRQPILFIQGKIDNIAPPEAAYPLYRMVGAKFNKDLVAPNVDKLFFEASEMNGFRFDYDHYALFLSPTADTEVYRYLIRWLNR